MEDEYLEAFGVQLVQNSLDFQKQNPIKRPSFEDPGAFGKMFDTSLSDDTSLSSSSKLSSDEGTKDPSKDGGTTDVREENRIQKNRMKHDSDEGNDKRLHSEDAEPKTKSEKLSENKNGEKGETGKAKTEKKDKPEDKVFRGKGEETGHEDRRLSLSTKKAEPEKGKKTDAEKKSSKESDGNGGSAQSDHPSKAENIPFLLTRETPQEAKNRAVIEVSIEDTGEALQGKGGVLNKALLKDKDGKKTEAEKAGQKKFSLVDARSKGGEKNLRLRGANSTSRKTKAAEGKEKSQDKANPELVKAVKHEILDDQTKVIRFDHHGQSGTGEVQQGKNIPPRTYNALLHQLKDNTNQQIVKQTGIILKDANNGEIKLILKPESLGKVRIQLNLHDNTITGKIVVDSHVVRQAFEHNLEALYRGFKESGFESAQLDVQVGGDRRQGSGKGGDSGAEKNWHKIKMMEEQIPLVRSGNFSDSIIDLVV